jgi:hypothetical protein
LQPAAVVLPAVAQNSIATGLQETSGANVEEAAGANEETASANVEGTAGAKAAARPEELFQVDLPAMAQVCLRMAAAKAMHDLEPLMEDACRVLNANGLVVWLWEAEGGVLRPSLSFGYSRQVLARLPALTPEAKNAIGAAFRSGLSQLTDGEGFATSAIALPLVTARGCGGVLAVEYPTGQERQKTLEALATILAAQLSLHLTAEPLARSAIA